MPPSHGLQSSLLGTSNGALTPGTTSMAAVSSAMIGATMSTGYGEPSTQYDLWDPNHWMLDNLLDFNYNYAQPLEGA